MRRPFGLGPAVGAALAMLGCAEVEPPALLTELTAPTQWRVGTPLQVAGRGLAGRALRIDGIAAKIPLQWAGSRSDGQELAWGHLPADAKWRDGQHIRQICLDGEDLAGWDPCLAADARLVSDWHPRLDSLQAQAPWQWGQLAEVRGAELLLPGEGEQLLEVESGGQVRIAGLTTRLAQGRTLGETAIAPHWLGPQPGDRLWRMRLVGTAKRGDGSAVSAATPWGSWQASHIQAPELKRASGVTGWRRGDWSPAAAQGVANDGSWRLEWSGHWHWRSASAAMEATTLGGPAGHSPTSSAWWRAALPWAIAPERFDGQVRLVVAAGGDLWASAPLGVAVPLLPTLQRVEVEAGAAWRAALTRLGLQAHAAAVEQALLQRLRQLFSGYALEISLVAAPQADGREKLRLRLGDRDGNGLQLLGAESGLAKDVGNQKLDEQLAGFDPAAWQNGQAAVSGVFAGELLGFSARLHPGRPGASPAFDEVFAPWCGQLGGTAATASQAAAAQSAIRQMAWAVAEVSAHEIGHALGLAAGGDEAHHLGDHPGWIMDSGDARPWAERAGLAGAAPSQWGPVDAGYLQAILPAMRR